MTGKLIIEGIGLGCILILICYIGIHNGAVGMVQLYSKEVQDRCVELGLVTEEKIKQRATKVRVVSMLIYNIYVLVCVYGINKAHGFQQGFLHIFVILSIMNLIDRFVIDEYWVGHTNAWVIPGTEDLRPYITKKDKIMKWCSGTIGMAAFSAIIAGLMSFIIQ